MLIVILVYMDHFHKKESGNWTVGIPGLALGSSIFSEHREEHKMRWGWDLGRGNDPCLSGCLSFMIFLVLVLFSCASISQLIGWEVWVLRDWSSSLLCMWCGVVDRRLCVTWTISYKSRLVRWNYNYARTLTWLTIEWLTLSANWTQWRRALQTTSWRLTSSENMSHDNRLGIWLLAFSHVTN